MKTIAASVVFVLIVGASVDTCRAGLMIQPVGVSTDMGETGSFDLSHVTDQSGLSSGYTSGVTDDTYSSIHTTDNENMWLSSVGNPSGFVTFDLGSSLQLLEFRLWNASASLASGETGVVGFTLFSDSDSDPTNGTSENLGSFEAVASTLTFQSMQTFEVSATTQFVQMQITSNAGGADATSFGEAAFVAVPEPSTIVLFGIGVLGAAALVRRRWRSHN